MPLKSSVFKTDFRHQMLAIVFIPLLIWLGALIFIITSWRVFGSVIITILLFMLGGWMAKLSLKLFYPLARRYLPAPLAGTAGKDYLLFDAEPPETVHITKLLPEDAGFIYANDQGYHLITLQHDYHVPFDAFHFEYIIYQGKKRAILLRFVPAGCQIPVEIAVSCKYYGNDVDIAGDIESKHEWAYKVLDAMRPASVPPPLARH